MKATINQFEHFTIGTLSAQGIWHLLRCGVGASIDVFCHFLEAVFSITVVTIATNWTAKIELHPIRPKRLLQTFGEALLCAEEKDKTIRLNTAVLGKSWAYRKLLKSNLDLL